MTDQLSTGRHSLSRIFYNRPLALLLWFGLSALSVLQALSKNGTNNFLIYRQVFYHTLQQINLYAEYPQQYYDVNLYGPFFSLVIAPFALLPVKAGAVCWVAANCAFLLLAILSLPVSEKAKTFLVLLCANELMISNGALQTNALVGACIILGFSLVQKGKEGWALFFIMGAAFVKLYGAVAFCFFFFSKKPLRFAAWAALWTALLFLAPLLISSFSFLVQSYKNWAAALQVKDAKNISLDASAIHQNISVMGMIKRIFGLPQLNSLLVLLPAFLVFASQYLPYRYWADVRYRLYMLCSVLLATVIFSTGSENTTYIISLPGICLWFLLQPGSRRTTVFFMLVFVLTTFAYSDLLTPWSRRHLYHPYSLKALPSFVLWVVIAVQIHRKQFLKARQPVLLLSSNTVV